MSYASAADIRGEVARYARPSDRISVADAASRNYRVRTSSGLEAWNQSVTPYMVEPINMLTSRQYEAVVFIGPARTGKTGGLLACVAYIVTCDPGDAMIVHMTQDKAGRFSKKDLARMYRDSPRLKAELSHRASDDNVFEKHHRAGNILYMGWPSITQLSGETLKYVLLTDYDRMPMSVGGEGTPFNLAKKRSQTFLSRGSTFVETSPGYEVTDAQWTPTSPHEAPPADGAFSLYNLGTRNRWYWPCPECGDYVQEPSDYSGFSFRHERDLLQTTIPEQHGPVGIICPSCGVVVPEDHPEQPIKRGLWVPAGCRADSDGTIIGEPRKVPYATYWLSGAAAAFQTWTSIVVNYLQAERVYDTTRDEEALRNVTNLDMGAAYLPRRLQSQTDANVLSERAESFPRGEVPPAVRFILATVDVQGGKDRRFVVQVIGYGEHLESWIVDRYSIRYTGEGDTRRRVNPTSLIEDWDMLTAEVLGRAYPIQGDSTVGLRVHAMAVDSGGEGDDEGGVTQRAYDYWRALRRKRLAAHVYLIKGASTAAAPRIQETYPDNTARKDRIAKARGDVRVMRVNTNKLKDSLAGDLSRDAPGPGYMHWPDWLSKSFYAEMTRENRDGGKWRNPGHGRNEAWDLYAYGRAICTWLGADNMDWINPMPWARPYESNSNRVVMSDVADKAAATLRPPPKKKRRSSGGGIAPDGWLL